MTAPDPALAQALDSLTMQVNQDNILAVHKVFHDYARDLDNEILRIGQNTRLGLCGLDPVSRDAAGSRGFGGKIDQLLEVHRAHQRELVVAADHLRRIARNYGIAESEIEQSVRADR